MAQLDVVGHHAAAAAATNAAGLPPARLPQREVEHRVARAAQHEARRGAVVGEDRPHVAGCLGHVGERAERVEVRERRHGAAAGGEVRRGKVWQACAR